MSPIGYPGKDRLSLIVLKYFLTLLFLFQTTRSHTPSWSSSKMTWWSSTCSPPATPASRIPTPWTYTSLQLPAATTSLIVLQIWYMLLMVFYEFLYKQLLMSQELDAVFYRACQTRPYRTSHIPVETNGRADQTAAVTTLTSSLCFQIPAFYSVGRQGNKKTAGFSDKLWPINGGEWAPASCSYSEIILTG